MIAREVDAESFRDYLQSRGKYVQVTFKQQFNLQNYEIFNLRQYRLVIAATDSKSTNQ